MTPQELMDLPYAGMAEKRLREKSSWILEPQENLDIALNLLEETDLVGMAIRYIESAVEELT